MLVGVESRDLLGQDLSATWRVMAHESLES